MIWTGEAPNLLVGAGDVSSIVLGRRLATQKALLNRHIFRTKMCTLTTPHPESPWKNHYPESSGFNSSKFAQRSLEAESLESKKQLVFNSFESPW